MMIELTWPIIYLLAVALLFHLWLVIYLLTGFIFWLTTGRKIKIPKWLLKILKKDKT